MRVAVIVIGIVMVSTPSYASKSCMSLAEARQQLGQVHLYWHGSGHCWDANANRHGFISHARHTDVRQVQRDDSEPNAADSKTEELKWRDAMSEMLPADAPVFRSAAAAVPVEEQGETPVPGLNWLDRWVDVVQVFPRLDPAAPSASPTPPAKFEPLVTPVRVLLAFLAIIVTLAVIEILFRSTIHEYRK
jgi:hypothetical protein